MSSVRASSGNTYLRDAIPPIETIDMKLIEESKFLAPAQRTLSKVVMHYDCATLMRKLSAWDAAVDAANDAGGRAREDHIQRPRGTSRLK